MWFHQAHCGQLFVIIKECNYCSEVLYRFTKICTFYIYYKIAVRFLYISRLIATAQKPPLCRAVDHCVIASTMRVISELSLLIFVAKNYQNLL